MYKRQCLARAYSAFPFDRLSRPTIILIVVGHCRRRYHMACAVSAATKPCPRYIAGMCTRPLCKRSADEVSTDLVRYDPTQPCPSHAVHVATNYAADTISRLWDSAQTLRRLCYHSVRTVTLVTIVLIIFSRSRCRVRLPRCLFLSLIHI